MEPTILRDKLRSSYIGCRDPLRPLVFLWMVCSPFVPWIMSGDGFGTIPVRPRLTWHVLVADGTVVSLLGSNPKSPCTWIRDMDRTDHHSTGGVTRKMCGNRREGTETKGVESIQPDTWNIKDCK